MLATETNKQILIVDRDVAGVEPLRQRLGEAGFIVRAITDGSAAIVAVAERPPNLVIIDWNVPGLAALEVIQGVRRARAPRAVRLIILSALSAEQDVVTGLNLGADDYIAKPFSVREVVARVCSVLRSHQYEDQRSALSCSTSTCSACGKSSRNSATRLISRPCADSGTGSPARRRAGRNEASISFLPFHATFHA
jgi:DNA-binding response OmpR family regulator